MNAILRNYQITAQQKIKLLFQSKGGSLVIIFNAVMIAFIQEPCVEKIISLMTVAHVVANSIILMIAFADVRLVNFLKLFIVGGVANITTKVFIGLYMRYFEEMGTRCKLPLYTSDYFTLTIVSILFIGGVYWSMTGYDKKEDTPNYEEDFK